MNIATATRDDAGALAALHGQCFDDAWDAKACRDLLAGPETFALAAPSAQPWQGFVIARVAAGEAEIVTIATLPAARRRGHARALVLAASAEAARRGAEELFLEVATDNTAAIALYSGLGFVPVGQRPRYYVRGTSPGDALILRSALPLSAALPS